MYSPFSLAEYERRLGNTRLTPFFQRGYAEAAAVLLRLCHAADIRVRTHTARRCYYTRSNNRITLGYERGPARLLHAWLHEIGHAAVDPELLGTRFGLEGSRPVRATPMKRLQVLDAELDAWYTARNVIHTHDLVLREDLFNEQETSALRSYVAWAHGDGVRAVKRKGW